MGMVTYQMWRNGEAARHRQREATLHAYQVLTTQRIQQRRAALQSLGRERSTLMSRVKSALMNKFSRRRELHGSEGAGPRAESLHRSPSRDGGSGTNRRGDQAVSNARSSQSQSIHAHRQRNR